MPPNIIKEPDSLLHKKCESVTDFNEAEKIVKQLISTVKSVAKTWNRWLGFAANQIGYSQRIIVLRTDKDTYEIMINPTLTERKFPFPYVETCHSVDGVYLVKRYLWSKIKYQDLKSRWKEMTLKGPSAIYQEIDHIDGLLVSDVGVRIL